MAMQKREVMGLLNRRVVPETSKGAIDAIFSKAAPGDARALANIATLLRAANYFVDDSTFQVVVENVADRYGESGQYRVTSASHIPEIHIPDYKFVPYQNAIVHDLRERGKVADKTAVLLTTLFWTLAADEPDKKKEIEEHAENLMVLGDVILDASVLQRALSHVPNVPLSD